MENWFTEWGWVGAVFVIRIIIHFSVDYYENRFERRIKREREIKDKAFSDTMKLLINK